MAKKMLLLIVLTGLVSYSAAQPSLHGEWTLVLNEEFDRFVDTVWFKYHEQRPKQPDYTMHWDSNAAIIDNGKLGLIAHTLSDFEYASGAVATLGKFEFRYGYVEARIQQPPKTAEQNTAFWLYPAGGTWELGEGAADGAEIDIMETPHDEDRYNATAHWDGYRGDHESTHKTISAPGMHSGFHTYGCLWTPDSLAFFYDGEHKASLSSNAVPKVMQHIKVSGEFHRWADRNARNATTHPDTAYIDWVKVWQITGQEDFAWDPDSDDVLAPSAITNLRINTVTESYAHLLWDMGSMPDNYGIRMVKLFRDGEHVQTVGGMVQVTDYYLEPGKTYEYKAKRYDCNGNESPWSETLLVTTPGDPVQAAPSNAQFDKPQSRASSIKVGKAHYLPDGARSGAIGARIESGGAATDMKGRAIEKPAPAKRAAQ